MDRNIFYGNYTLWVRAVYREGFLDGSITAVVRPGNRSDPSGPTGHGLPRGQDVCVRFIKKAGNRANGIEPEFYPDDGTTIQVAECIVKRIRHLTPEDLRGVAPDTATPELVRYHLGTIYDTPLPNSDDVVTIWRFKYQPKATE